MNSEKTAQKTLRVLMLAELCNPDWVSVPLVGWNVVRHMGNHVDVYLVTSQRNKENIDKNGFFKNKVLYIDQSILINFLVILGRIILLGRQIDHITFQAMTFIFYPFFELQTFWRLRKKFKNRDFDLIHRVTPLSPAIPSILALISKLYRIPFILGPINGGLPWPKEFEHLKSRDQDLLSPFRFLVKFLPFYQSTRSQSSAILVGSNATLAEIAPKYLHKTYYMPENGLTEQEIPGTSEKNWDGPLMALFVGRLVALKGVDMTIEALAPFLLKNQILLTVIGEGTELNALQELVKTLQVEKFVTFTGWVDRKKLGEYYRKAHVFPFFSVKEFGGGALIEAMSFGLIPIVLDYGGPGEIVQDTCGYKLPMASRDHIIKSAQKKVHELFSDMTEAKKKSLLAKERIINDFLWTKKSSKILEIYKKLTQVHQEESPNQKDDKTGKTMTKVVQGQSAS